MVAAIFAVNPKIETLHVADDGQAFTNDEYARQHQKALLNKEDGVEKVDRKDVEEEIEAWLEENAPKEEGKPAKETDITKMKMEQLKAVAKANEYPEEEWSGIKSKADLIEYINKKIAEAAAAQ